MEIKTAALIGLGAIGSYIAPGLEKALGHGNFRVIAEGDRRERLETSGTTINGVNYKFAVVKPSVKDPADLVIVIVKHNGLSKAIEDIAGQVGENTTIVSFMNGVTSEDELSKAFGPDKVIYGLTRVSVVMRDHVTQYNPNSGYMAFGEAKNTVITPRIQAIADLFSRAGIPYQIPEDMVRAIWLKYMCNVSENQSSAILGIPFGAWHVSNNANAVREMAMREVVAIANAKGIDLNQDDISKQAVTLKGIPYENKTSMLQDLESHRLTEVDMFSGTVIKMGRELNIPTPVNEVFYHCIKVLEEKNSGYIRV